jgi:CheY-like chemotaxis protein
VFANLLHNVVERHGGRVDAYSDGRGAGSTFVVRLPLAAPAAAGSPAAPVEASAPAARRILVVDDNEDAATSLAMLLGIMGHDARTTFDGASALEEAARFRPHVALLDLGIPARRWLRRGPPHSAGVMGPRRDARGADRLGAGGAQTPIGAGRLRSAPRQARRSQSTRGAAGVLTHAAAVAAVLTRASMVEAMRDASLATPWIIVDDIAWRK